MFSKKNKNNNKYFLQKRQKMSPLIKNRIISNFGCGTETQEARLCLTVVQRISFQDHIAFLKSRHRIFSIFNKKFSHPLWCDWFFISTSQGQILVDKHQVKSIPGNAQFMVYLLVVSIMCVNSQSPCLSAVIEQHFQAIHYINYVNFFVYCCHHEFYLCFRLGSWNFRHET